MGPECAFKPQTHFASYLGGVHMAQVVLHGTATAQLELMPRHATCTLHPERNWATPEPLTDAMNTCQPLKMFINPNQHIMPPFSSPKISSPDIFKYGPTIRHLGGVHEAQVVLHGALDAHQHEPGQVAVAHVDAEAQGLRQHALQKVLHPAVGRLALPQRDVGLQARSSLAYSA